MWTSKQNNCRRHETAWSNGFNLCVFSSHNVSDALLNVSFPPFCLLWIFTVISEGFVIVARYINDKAFHLEERIECGAGFCVLSLLKIVRGHKKKASLGQTLIIKPPAGFSGTWSENLLQPVRGQPGEGAHCFFAILLLYFHWHQALFLFIFFLAAARFTSNGLYLSDPLVSMAIKVDT